MPLQRDVTGRFRKKPYSGPASFHRFSSLSTEVRLNIYAYVFKDAVLTLKPPVKAETLEHTVSAMHDSVTNLALLRTNRQVYGEAIHELYKHVTCIPYDWFDGPIMYRVPSRRLIRSTNLPRFFDLASASSVRHLAIDICTFTALAYPSVNDRRLRSFFPSIQSVIVSWDLEQIQRILHDIPWHTILSSKVASRFTEKIACLQASPEDNADIAGAFEAQLRRVGSWINVRRSWQIADFLKYNEQDMQFGRLGLFIECSFKKVKFIGLKFMNCEEVEIEVKSDAPSGSQAIIGRGLLEAVKQEQRRRMKEKMNRNPQTLGGYQYSSL